MSRRLLFIPILAVAILASIPFLSGQTAEETRAWSSFESLDSWIYEAMLVDAVDESSLNLKSYDDVAVLVKRAKSCQGSCDLRDLAILSDGGYVLVTDVPSEALDESQIAVNDERIVYAEVTTGAKASTIDVIEIDLSDGERRLLVDDGAIELTEIGEVTPYVENEIVYLEINDRLWGYHPHNNKITRFFDHRSTYVESEKFATADGNEVVALVTFVGGEKQLWLYGWVDNGPQTAQALPGTWTVSKEDIVAAHFTSAGYLEFFRQYARHLSTDTVKTSTDPWETKSFKQFMSWYRSYDLSDLTNIVQVRDGIMAWVDSTNHLYVSDGTNVNFVASIGENGVFAIDGEWISWNDGWTGGIISADGGDRLALDFFPTDVRDDLIVGVNRSGEIIYLNRDMSETLTLGFGSEPRLADGEYVYWKGADGRFYQAKILMPYSLDVEVGEPVKVAGSVRVYLLSEDGELTYVPNEYTFYTWFDSFAVVRTMTDAELASYSLSSKSATLKSSTLLTIDQSPKVYMIGADGLLHWLVNEETVEALYGPAWESLVRSYTTAQMLAYDFGDDLQVDDDEDIEDIVRLATVKK